MEKERLLFLCQRLPDRADRGDKIRSLNLLRGLASRYDIHLGTFAVNREEVDLGWLNEICVEVFVCPPPRAASVQHLKSLVSNRSQSLGLFFDSRMSRWVDSVIERNRIDRAIASSGVMAHYLLGREIQSRVCDFVDVDSEKWRVIAANRSGLAAWLYRREHQLVLAHEYRVATELDASVFISAHEAQTFEAVHGMQPGFSYCIGQGIDTSFFKPDAAHHRPFPLDVDAIVFTGVMDYWPNVDAMRWFTESCLPQIRERVPRAELWIVGSNPNRIARGLGRRPGVHVTGRVGDVRSFLQHASVVVAPMRVGCGVQNKVLEAMAMARPIVATSEALTGIDLPRSLHPFDGAESIVNGVVGHLASLGALDPAADLRQHVLSTARWKPSIDRIIGILEGEAED